MMSIKTKFSKIISHVFMRTSVQPRNGEQPEHIWSLPQGNLILCNFCGTVFPRSGPDHSEFLACPYCDAIARERVAYQAILHQAATEQKETPLFFNGVKMLSQVRLLECSPRFHPNRRAIYEQTLGQYMSTDFDMSAHKADIQIDLTNEQHIAKFEEAFDVIICSHVLEHIPMFACVRAYSDVSYGLGKSLPYVDLKWITGAASTPVGGSLYSGYLG